MAVNLRKGIYLAILTSVISGFSIFFNKFAVGIIQPPLVFTAVKNIEVGILIFAILLFSKKFNKVKKLNKREIIYLFLIGLIGGAIPFYLFFTGLSQVSAINAALIQKTLVIWVALLAIPFLEREALSSFIRSWRFYSSLQVIYSLEDLKDLLFQQVSYLF